MSLTMVNRGVVNCNRTNTHVSSLGQIILKENLHMLNVYINCSYSHLLNIHFLILKSLFVHGKHINDSVIHYILIHLANLTWNLQHKVGTLRFGL